MPLHYVLIFSLLGSVGSLTGAGALIALPKMHNRLKQSCSLMPWARFWAQLSSASCGKP